MNNSDAAGVEVTRNIIINCFLFISPGKNYGISTLKCSLCSKILGYYSIIFSSEMLGKDIILII